MQAVQNFVRHVLPPLVSLLVVLVVWDLAVRGFGIDRFLLPTPDQVARVLLGRSQELFSATLLTLFNAGSGFLLSMVCGTAIAVLFAEFRWLRISCYPYAIFLHTVPIVAISPLIITWFDYGNQSVIVITFIVSLFPVITGATNGLLSASTELKELFALYHASRWQTLLKLKFPAAVPQMVTGAQTASGMAVVGAIVGEFFAGYDSAAKGLGYYIFAAQGQFRTDVLLAVVLLSTLLGIALFAAVTLTANTLLRRWTVV